MPRGNIKNLIPNSERTPEELREQCKRAGKKSGEVRRAKADMRELMKLMLDEQMPHEKMTYGQSLTKSMLTIAANPKQGAAAVRAYETILRITGQDEPEQKSDAIDLLKAILDNNKKNAELQTKPETE